MEKNHFEILLEEMKSNFQLAFEGLDGVNGRLDKLEAGQKTILVRLDQLEAGQKAVLARLDNVEAGQGTIKFHS